MPYPISSGFQTEIRDTKKFNVEETGLYYVYFNVSGTGAGCSIRINNVAVYALITKSEQAISGIMLMCRAGDVISVSQPSGVTIGNAVITKITTGYAVVGRYNYPSDPTS